MPVGTRKRNPNSLKALNRKAWKLMSEWVRRKNADWRGYVACVTCDKQYIWNSGDIHAGHWIHDKLDYDSRNINPQCKNCNYKYNKNVNTRYGLFMARTYGVEVMDELIKLSNTKGNNYTILELKEIIEDLKHKINELPN